jgi:DNA-binding transcriptional regulator YhcF (GntR family)
MMISMRLHVDAHSPIPIRWELAEQLKHAIERGGVPRNQPLPSIRELAGFLGINPNTVSRAVEDLKRSGYVEARRGKRVFVASTLPTRTSPTLREDFLMNVVTWVLVAVLAGLMAGFVMKRVTGGDGTSCSVLSGASS